MYPVENRLQSLKRIVNGNPLAEGFVDWLFQSVVKVRFVIENQGKAVDGTVPEV